MPIGFETISRLCAPDQGYRFSYGHFTQLEFSSFPTDWYRFTLLRHPIERLLSQYSFHRHGTIPISSVELVRKAQELSFPEYVRYFTDHAPSSLFNGQARFMLGTLAYQLDDEELLKKSATFLETLDLVGTCDDVTEAVLHIFLECQLGIPPYVGLENVTHRRLALSDLSSNTIKELETLEWVDLELYRLAKNWTRQRRHKFLNSVLLSATTSADGISSSERKKFASDCIIHEKFEHTTHQEIQSRLESTFESNPQIPAEFGSRIVEIIDLRLQGNAGESTLLEPGEQFTIHVIIRANATLPQVTVGFHIETQLGELVFGTNTWHLGGLDSVYEGQIYRVAFSMRLSLGAGIYFITAAAHTRDAYYEQCYHVVNRRWQFEVTCGQHNFIGIAQLYPNVQFGEFENLSSFVGGKLDLIAHRKLLVVAPGENCEVPVTLCNSSPVDLNSEPARLVFYSYHLLDSNGNCLVMDGVRTRIPVSIPEGGKQDCVVKISAPTETGSYIVRVTLVQELCFWFDQLAPPLYIDIVLEVGG